MWIKLWAWILSFLSFFAVWNINGQPNNIPETREYRECADNINIWPTEEFTLGKAPLLWGDGLRGLYAALGFVVNKSGHNDSFLVLHKGKLVYEYYGEGQGVDIPHRMYSVTKSVLSALVGIALLEGDIGSVQDKVIDYFPEAVIPAGQESKRTMTIEHLLTMTSGLPGDDNLPMEYLFGGEDGFSLAPEWQFLRAKDSGLAAFLTEQAAAPGEKYIYSSGAGSQTLACLISRAVKQNLYDYAKEKLFGPLGMTSVTWDAAQDGNSYGGFGISMTSRDMARFGYLYLRYGKWDGEQILPADYVAVTPPRSNSVAGYGYLFWNNALLPFGRSYQAMGLFGQYITILPGCDTVIVRTGKELV